MNSWHLWYSIRGLRFQKTVDRQTSIVDLYNDRFTKNICPSLTSLGYIISRERTSGFH